MEDKWIMLYRTFQGEKLSLLGFGILGSSRTTTLRRSLTIS